MSILFPAKAPVTSVGRLSAPVTSVGRIAPAKPKIISPVAQASNAATIAAAAANTTKSVARQELPPRSISPIRQTSAGIGIPAPSPSPEQFPIVVLPKPPETYQPYIPAPEAPPAYTPPAPPEQYTVPSDAAYEPPPFETPFSTNATEELTKSGGASTSTALAVVPPVVKPTLWERILAWFGLAKKSASKINGEELTRAEGAAQLVRRARNGDQNAMAIIALVRENAMKGNTQAVISQKLIQKYIEKYPYSAMGSEFYENVNNQDINDTVSIETEAVKLSHGPYLSNPRIEMMLNEYSANEQEAFAHGLSGGTASFDDGLGYVREAYLIGCIVGEARRLQNVRKPGSPVSNFDPMVGWEMGE